LSSRALVAVAVAVIVALSDLRAGEPDAKIAPWLASRLSGGGSDSFLVLFDDGHGIDAALDAARASKDPGRAVYDLLRRRAASSQAGVRYELSKAGIPFRSLYIVNGLAVRGDLALARRLAVFGEVASIVGDPSVRGVERDVLAPPATPDAGVEWGVNRIEADKVWTLDGIRGEGVVVASADTGVEWTHPAIIAKYRGWNGSTASHDFNWFDAIEDLAEPLDDFDHGTHTTGTMVGDDGAGNQVGVAPGARWIACRNMDHGNGQPSTYIACNQYFLAPFPHGGDPETDGDPSKAPNIVNNSWSCPPSEGCSVNSLRASFAALRAAGILAVDSAGNNGSACSSVFNPPGIYDESFVVGATDNANFLAGSSSRGPVTVDGSGRLKPDVAAPGVAVLSSVRGGGYAILSGTSMASPHTAGAAALLWSAKPQLRGLIGLTRCLISKSSRGIVQISTPQTCGGTGVADRPNNLWGYGLIDAYDAIHLGPDADGDGIASACDCAPSNGGAYDVPGEVDELGFAADKVTLSWTSLAGAAGSGTVYDVISGDLSDLRASGVIAGASCLGSAATATTRLDPSLPGVGQGIYDLVQARNVCGLGGFGTASDLTARAHGTCP
jgi:subtilisin family serine protease